MALTGRAAAIALIAVLPIAVSPWPAVVFAVVALVLAVAVGVDVALAGDPAALRCRRSGPSSARLGEPVDSVLHLRNGGRRRVRGVLRDAWPPSAAAQPRTRDIDLDAGGRWWCCSPT